MEVHHHPQLHHEKKPWKEYLLEGLMIFIAVMMGFFAESYRERLSEHAKESEYIVSMINDLKTDTTNLNYIIAQYDKSHVRIDTLLEYLPSLKKGFNMVFKRNEPAVMSFPDFGYTDNTIQQLKSSEGMRLIRNLKAVKGILNYDAVVKSALTNQASLGTLLDRMDIFRSDFFNYQALDNELRKHKTFKNIEDEKLDILFTHNDQEIAKFYNKIENYSMVSLSIESNMKDVRIKAIKLIKTLKEEYNLNDE